MFNNVVLVWGVQHSDSVISIRVSILFLILFPFEYWAELPVLYSRSLLVSMLCTVAVQSLSLV